MLLGVYDVYLISVSMVNMRILFPMCIGPLIGSFFFMKIIQFLLKKYPSQTYYGIIGFVVGSIPVLFPDSFTLQLLLPSIVFLFLGFTIGFLFEKK